MKPSLTPDIRQQIEVALYAGQKITAIKLYRESTGKGLAEAKADTDKIEAELRRLSPERFTSTVPIPFQMGCLHILGYMLIGVFGALLLWASRNGNTLAMTRYQRCMDVSLPLTSAVAACVFSLQPKWRLLSTLSFAVTVLLVSAIIYRELIR